MLFTLQTGKMIIKKEHIIIALLTVAFVIVSVFLFKECSKESDIAPIISTSDTITVIDTLSVTDTLYYPFPDTIIIHEHDSIKDTSALIDDYLNEKVYKKSFSDTSYNINLNISVEKNALKTLDYGIELYLPTKTIVNTIVKKEVFSISAGGEIGFKFKTKMPLIAPEIDFSFNKHVIGGGYEFFGKEVKLSYKYKFLVITK